MCDLIEFLSMLVRLVRGSRGAHAAPRRLRRDLQEARASRVRRYAESVPVVAVAPRPPGPALVPVPDDYVPVVDPTAVHPPAAIVRGHYRAYEARQDRARVDRDRLGVAVLMDLAKIPA